MSNGSPLAPDESFWTRMSKLGPPMMGQMPPKRKEKKERARGNVVVFADGTEISIAEEFRSADKAGEVADWAVKWANDHSTKPITLDVDNIEDPFNTPVNPYANIGIGGPPDEGFMNKAGNVAANVMTGGGGVPGSMFDVSEFTQEPQFKPSDIRATTDLVGTEGGATGGAAAGGRAGSRFGPLGSLGGAITGAAVGGAGMNQGADAFQKLVGVEPREENPLHVGAREGAYELFGRGFMGSIGGLWRGAKALGKYDPMKIKERAAAFTTQKVKPFLFQVVEPGGWADSVRLWVAKNPATGRVYRKSIEDQYNKIAGNVYKNTDVFVKNTMQAPTPTIAGKAITGGIEKFNKSFFKESSDLYDEVWRMVPESSPIPWKATREFLGGSASSNPLLASVGSPKIRQIANAFNDELVTTNTKNLPGGQLAILEQVKDIDLDTARKLRTAVGEKIRDWTPDADLPIKELQKFYGALTDDIMLGVEKHGGPGAREALEKANGHWAENMSKQETLMDGIYKAIGKDSTKAWDNALGLINGNRLESLEELKRRMDLTPGSWDHFRNMVLRQNIAPSSAGLKEKVLWSDKYINLREKVIKDPGIEDMMFGSASGTPKEKAMRNQWDSLLDIAKHQDEILKINKSGDVRSRFTSSEMYGPWAAGIGAGAGTGGVLGYQQGQDGDVGGAAIGAATGGVIALGLSAISARSAWKLVSNPDYVKVLSEIQRKSDVPLSSAVARIGGTYASLDYEGKQALMEYMAAMKELINPQTYEDLSQQRRGPLTHGR